MTASGDPVRTVAQLARAQADATESGRRLPVELVDAMVAAGIFGLCVPQRWGGIEAHPATMVETIEQIAFGDGSAGWCAMIGATTGVVAGYLPDEVAQRIYGTGGRSVTGGVFAPLGVATPTAAGYRVRGRWPFASGCEHADWLMGGCMIEGEPSIPPRMAIVPAATARVIDTWHVTGLRGTGSHDIVLEDVLVPASWTVSFVADRPRVSGPLYAFPVFGLLALGIAAVALGIARAAVDELCALAAGKRPSGSRRLLRDRATVQVEVAQAEAERRSARAHVDEAVGTIWRLAERGDPVTIRDRALLRLAATHAVTLAAQVTTRMYTLGGGTAVYASSPLQRCFRDAHVATQHTMVAAPTLDVVGRILLGLDTDAAML